MINFLNTYGMRKVINVFVSEIAILCPSGELALLIALLTQTVINTFLLLHIELIKRKVWH